MHRRGFAVAGTMALVLAGATVSQAAASKHHVSQTVKLVTVSLNGNYPNPGSSSVDAGLISGSLGRGAVSQVVRITGHPAATTYTFKSTSTAFYAHGTITSVITGTATLQANGSAKLAGLGRYKGGTDAFRGARGSFRIAGTIPPASPNKPTPAVIHASGTISY